MNGSKCFYRFEFDYKTVFDKQVDSIRFRYNESFVSNWQNNLSL